MVTQPSPARPVGVVGAGLVGLAVARQLAEAHVPVLVFEKETAVAQHQSGHNSGVVHAGIYYLPGSAKATLCRRGVELLSAYCADRGLPWDARGKLVVARDDAETAKLREIERRAAANGVPGRAVAGRGGHPGAGAGDHRPGRTAVADHGHRRLPRDRPLLRRRRRGSRRAGADRDAGDRRAPPGATTWRSARPTARTGCPGWSSARACSPTCSPPRPATRPRRRSVPFRGEYLRLRLHARDRVRHLIYPVPDPAYPFLGVHLTPRIDGEVDIGPNAVLALAREGYRRRDVSGDQLSRLARSAAFRQLARQNWRAGVREMRGSVSRKAFLAEARTYLPWLGPGDVMAAPAGVRAQAVDRDGALVDDFRIHQIGPVTAVRNAPSPAATASLAIAERIVAQLSISLSSTGGTTPGTL